MNWIGTFRRIFHLTAELANPIVYVQCIQFFSVANKLCTDLVWVSVCAIDDVVAGANIKNVTYNMGLKHREKN